MDKFNRTWITENALEEIEQYEKGVLTIRGLHYRLVARGMTNTIQHYKRVVNAMIQARWQGLVDFDTFSDNDRETIGFTDYEETTVESSVSYAKRQLRAWMNHYSKNRWENQSYYPEVFIEKKALQGVFQSPCDEMDVALSPCKGYPSLTFLYDASKRFKLARNEGKIPIILYFGDYDPSGEDIPRSIQQNFIDLGVTVEVKRIALLEEQVVEWNLPPAPAKKTDSRTANWDGLGQVELDAVDPKKLQRLCLDAINDIFDEEAYSYLMETEEEERSEYRLQLKSFVNDELNND
ncbi:MAG: hypothetical protein PVG07_00055 [Acidobacteriota bacterium]|jgi:hypothetical protein